ncbi:MAG: nucleotidyltransferase domain-containing protein [Candidatus Diapherotrites archaeon]|uniref:Nucleotidyltransferase domain-containing protein n=1 Tax=Candidatus Iainarchaeum sp. TaxID=3101447 RepID=A0A8T4LA51_9ARCH|nr:nucleotidyltransferase domain-containing protein [Candidatus Diapherotrites archaeon]
MVGKKIRISEPVQKLVARIKQRFLPAQIILFGSRARGEERNDSDWDILIISNQFEGITFRNRIDQILQLSTEPIGQDIEPFCYTPKEIEQRKTQLGIVKTALDTGTKIA